MQTKNPKLGASSLKHTTAGNLLGQDGQVILILDTDSTLLLSKSYALSTTKNYLHGSHGMKLSQLLHIFSFFPKTTRPVASHRTCSIWDSAAITHVKFIQVILSTIR
jgi:hypothetical protein